jgi:general secretion pathway protein C
MRMVRRQRLAVELVLLALIAYLAALGVSTGIANHVDVLPPAPAEAGPTPALPPAPLADYAVIASRDIFNPPADGRVPTGSVAGGQSLHLWGIALHGPEARAVIEDAATHRQDLYRVGDQVGGLRVAAIDWDRVLLAGTGGETTLELAPPPPDGVPAAGAEGAPEQQAEQETPRGGVSAGDGRIRRTAENAWMVDRRELAGAVDNMSGLLTQLRAVAEVRDGRPAGFRLFQIRDGSLFSRLGLRDGDVVQRVNGSAIADPAALLAFLKRLQTEPRVALDIVRRDAPRTLVYDLR